MCRNYLVIILTDPNQDTINPDQHHCRIYVLCMFICFLLFWWLFCLYLSLSINYFTPMENLSLFFYHRSGHCSTHCREFLLGTICRVQTHLLSYGLNAYSFSRYMLALKRKNMIVWKRWNQMETKLSRRKSTKILEQKCGKVWNQQQSKQEQEKWQRISILLTQGRVLYPQGFGWIISSHPEVADPEQSFMHRSCLYKPQCPYLTKFIRSSVVP